MPNIEVIVKALTNLTAVLSVLSLILAGLVLVDCLFLYKRITIFRKRQDQKREATHADESQ